MNDRPRPRREWIVALAAVLVVPPLLLAPALQSRLLLSAAEGLLDGYLMAGAAPDGHRRSNELLTDSYRQFIPWRSLTSRELRQGRLPFWNPYAYAGSPLLGNAQSAVFDPLSTPYVLAPQEPERATVWVALLRLWTAGLGALLLARRLGCGPPAAALAGIAYACGGFAVVWLLSPHTSSSAWLPWVLLCAERLVDRPGAGRAAELSVPLSLSAFGGHVEVAFFTAAAAAAYAAMRQLQHERGIAPLRRTVLWVLGAGLLCAALTAVQTVPFVEALDQGEVFHDRTSTITSEGLLTGFRPERLVSQFFPYLFGRPLRGEAAFWSVDSNFHGLAATYVGLLGSLLAITALARAERGPALRALAGIGLLAWAYHVGIPPVRWLGRQLPVVGLVPPERIAPIALCAFAVAGGVGLQGLLDRPPARRRVALGSRLVLATGGLTALLGLGMWVADGPFAAIAGAILGTSAGQALLGEQAPRVLAGLGDAVSGYGARYLLPWGILTIAAARVLRALPRGGGRIAWVAVTVVALDLLLLGRGYNPAVPAELVFPETDAIERVRAAAGDGRALMLQDGLPPNAATRYRIHDVQGYDAIDRARLGRLLSQAGPVRRFSALRAAESWVYDVLAVRVVTTPEARPIERLEPVGPIGSGFLYRNPSALPLAFVSEELALVGGPGDAERVLGAPGFDPRRVGVVEADGGGPASLEGVPVVERPTAASLRVTVAVESPGWLMISEGYDPGWTASSGGTPLDIRPAYLAIMAVDVPAGSNVIELRFRPRFWALSLTATLLGLVCSAALLVRERLLIEADADDPVP